MTERRVAIIFRAGLGKWNWHGFEGDWYIADSQHGQRDLDFVVANCKEQGFDPIVITELTRPDKEEE